MVPIEVPRWGIKGLSASGTRCWNGLESGLRARAYDPAVDQPDLIHHVSYRVTDG